MSLITRCPACTTLFKVVPDQLRVSEGWVRCGQCDEVFDANAHLQGASTATSQPASVQKSDAQSAPETEIGVGHSPVSADDVGLDTEPQMPADPAPELEQELAAQLEWPDAPSTSYDSLMDVRPGAVFQPEPALHLEMPGEDESEAHIPEAEALSDGATVDPVWEEPPAEPVLDLPDPAEPAEVYSPPQASAATSVPASMADHAPTFMRAARRETRWKKPWVRRSLASLAVLFAACLVMQVVLFERDRLASSVPDLRPALSAMCEALGCEIAPFKQIDSVVIDASSFVKVRGDVYRLNVTLKNTAPIDVAAPAVELTLTDTQDQPMIRRVLSPGELGALQGILVAGGELSAALPINVRTAGRAEHISGYRLLAFYP